MKEKTVKTIFLAVCAVLICAVAAFFAVGLSANGVSVDKGLDKEAPIITVDFEGYDTAKLPVGAVGVEYPIFGGTAQDYIDGEVTLRIRVYKVHTNKNLYDQGKHSFTPNAAETYILEYSAADASGNERCHKYGIKVVQTVSAPAISALTDMNAVTGVETALPAAQVSGGSGTPTENIKITLEGATVFEKTGFEGAKFKPTRNGVYTVTYTVRDHLGRVDEKTFSLTAANGSGPVVAPIHVPSSVVFGTRIDFGAFSATDYAGGTPTAAQTSLKVEYNGSTTVLTEPAYTPAKPASGNSGVMRVTFTAKGASGTAEFTRDITVINNVNDGGNCVLANYLALKNASVDASRPMRVTSDSANATAEYANDLIADGGRLAFTYGGMKSYRVILADAANSDIRVEIDVSDSASNQALLDVYVNGVKSERYTQKSENGTAIFSYTQATRMLRFNMSGTNALEDYCEIETNADGTPFNGFPSGKVRYTMVFGEKSGEDTMYFDITRVNGLTVSAATVSDNAGPEIAVPSYRRRYEKDDTATLGAAFAADVLNIVNTFTVSVTAPDGSKLITDADALTEQSFVLNAYGSYIVEYAATDTAGKRGQYRFALYVVDRVSPVITLAGEIPANGTAGTEIELPDFSVTDNMSTTEEISASVIVVTPSYEYMALRKDENGKIAFTPSKTGVYTVRYIAEDVDGNVAVTEKEIIVKE